MESIINTWITTINKYVKIYNVTYSKTKIHIYNHILIININLQRSNF